MNIKPLIFFGLGLFFFLLSWEISYTYLVLAAPAWGFGIYYLKEKKSVNNTKEIKA